MRVDVNNVGGIKISMTTRELLEQCSFDSLKDLAGKIPLTVLMDVVKEKMVEIELEKLKKENT